jgi:hypothetical protein
VTYLAEKTVEVLGDLQPELADAPDVHAVLDPLVREAQRLEAKAYEVADCLFPRNAVDFCNTLPMWESLLGLPVRQAGATLEQRRGLVTAAVRARTAASGAAWVDLVTTALGSPGWTHEEGPAAYNLTLRVPYVPGGITAGQLANIARRVTPAHLQINTTYTAGFLVGISLVGDGL